MKNLKLPSIYYDKIGLWAYRKFEYLKWEKSKWLPCLILDLLIPHCWQDDCNNQGEPCLLRGYDGEPDSIYWFCSEHSQRHGFCFGCGEFWGGTESFDFGPGYCSNCAPEFESDYDDEWVDDWSYDEAMSI